MSTILGPREWTVIAGGYRTIEVVGCGQQQHPAGFEAAVDVAHKFSIVKDVLDIFETDCHLERLAKLGVLVERPNILDWKLDQGYPTKGRPLCGDLLVATIPAQADRGISTPCRADGETAAAATDIDKPFAVAGAGQTAAQPHPAIQDQQIVVDKRRRKSN